jgi:hypothetical protein
MSLYCPPRDVQRNLPETLVDRQYVAINFSILGAMFSLQYELFTKSK